MKNKINKINKNINMSAAGGASIKRPIRISEEQIRLAMAASLEEEKEKKKDGYICKPSPPPDFLKKRAIIGDGNCLFRAISYALESDNESKDTESKQELHATLRTVICENIQTMYDSNKTKSEKNIRKRLAMEGVENVKDYLVEMSTPGPGKDGGIPEIISATVLIQHDIILFTYHKGEGEHVFEKYGENNNGKYILLFHCKMSEHSKESNHFVYLENVYSLDIHRIISEMNKYNVRVWPHVMYQISTESIRGKQPEIYTTINDNPDEVFFLKFRLDTQTSVSLEKKKGMKDRITLDIPITIKKGRQYPEQNLYLNPVADNKQLGKLNTILFKKLCQFSGYCPHCFYLSVNKYICDRCEKRMFVYTLVYKLKNLSPEMLISTEMIDINTRFKRGLAIFYGEKSEVESDIVSGELEYEEKDSPVYLLTGWENRYKYKYNLFGYEFKDIASKLKKNTQQIIYSIKKDSTSITPTDIWKFDDKDVLIPDRLVVQPEYELHLDKDGNLLFLYSKTEIKGLKSAFRKRKKLKTNKSKSLKKKKTNKSKSLKKKKTNKSKSLKKLKLKKFN